MKPSFLDALDERVLVCDGAMGTMLYARGVFINRSFDALNLAQPDLVGEVHREYLRAGADVIESNTFGANRVKLAAFGLSDRLHEINLTGAQIARGAARDRAWVAGAIGPLGIRIEPFGRTGVDEAETYFKEQAAALLEGGVDLFILETFRDVNEIGAAIAAVRSLTNLPIVAQMTTEEDGNSLDGTPPEEFGPALEARGATLIGVNCSVGPAPMLETIERLARATARKLSAQPNAGRPRDIEGRNIYLCSPEYMASYARRFIQRGVRLVGGCCGTTPEHIRQIRLAVNAQGPGATRVAVSGTSAPAAEPEAPPVQRKDKSTLARALAEGRSVVTVELEPPKGVDATEVLAQARRLAALGVDAITVSEGAKGSARMSALSLAILLKQEAGLEPVLQYQCRDRYLLGMQSDLLGAHATGIRNLLLVTGDPRKRGDYSDATLVFDVDSIGLANAVARLNRGRDVGGQAIGRATAFHVGVVGNPTAPRLDDEVKRFEYKAEAGAEFAITLPVFDLDALDAFVERTAHLRLPIIASVRPFDSLLHAEFLANEVPNLRVPEALLARMHAADGQGRAGEEGLAIAMEIADAVRGRVQGLQVCGPPAAVGAVLAGLALRG
ncbi:MAG: bifunctional homocysteine S-methyltransferase/methylenetetrahydrofolate reductase [Vicinamibacteria bacterium]|nr:bifunctional homocysteine S-methyltransferase/methylenetetrahydrofolate reductase [Vicinamibacteria bacterium]